MLIHFPILLTRANESPQPLGLLRSLDGDKVHATLAAVVAGVEPVPNLVPQGWVVALPRHPVEVVPEAVVALAVGPCKQGKKKHISIPKVQKNRFPEPNKGKIISFRIGRRSKSGIDRSFVDRKKRGNVSEWSWWQLSIFTPGTSSSSSSSFLFVPQGWPRGKKKSQNGKKQSVGTDFRPTIPFFARATERYLPHKLPHKKAFPSAI